MTALIKTGNWFTYHGLGEIIFREAPVEHLARMALKQAGYNAKKRGKLVQRKYTGEDCSWLARSGANRIAMELISGWRASPSVSYESKNIVGPTGKTVRSYRLIQSKTHAEIK